MFKWWLGPLMDEAGGGDAGGGVAVADTGGDFGGDTGESSGEGTDGQVHEAEFVDPGTELAPIETTEPGTALVKVGERPIQGGKLTGSGKAGIEAVRALDPKLAQTFTQSLFVSEYFRQQFPGGKKEVAALRQLAEQHGGEEGISKIKFMADEMSRIDSLYEASDPAFIEQITSTPEGQRGYVGLMAPAFAKFKALGGETFGHLVSKEFVELMNAGSIPTLFSTQAAILARANKAMQAGNHELAASFLTEIIQTNDSIAGVLDKAYQLAKNVPAARGSAQDPALDERSKQIAAGEAKLFKEQLDTAVKDRRRALFAKAWTEQTKGRTLTGDQTTNVKGFYDLRMTAKLREWKNQSARFLANKDREGYLKEQYAFFQQAIPDALKRAIEQALPAKPGPKVGTQPKPANGAPAPVNGKTPVRTAQIPAQSDIDWSLQKEGMIAQKKAYLKDGRLVTWA